MLIKAELRDLLRKRLEETMTELNHALQRSRFVSIEIIANESNLFSVSKMNIHQVSTDMSKINTGSSVSYFNMPKPLKGRKNHEQIANAISGVLRVISTWHAFSDR